MVQQVAKAFCHYRAGTGKSLRQDIGAQQHQGAHFGLAEGFADPGGVAAHEIVLERGNLIMTDMNVGQLSETGGDAVHHALFFDDRFDYGT